MERNKNVKPSKSPPKIGKHNQQTTETDLNIDDQNERINTIPKIAVSTIGYFRKTSTSKSACDLNNSSCEKCDRCSISKDNTVKALSHVRSFVDGINERLNLAYYKTGQVKKNNTNNWSEMEFSLDYLHTILYTELDKMRLGSEISNQIRYLMKSLKFFNDKFDYILKKHENFEKMAQDYKNMKLSNKTEDLNLLSEADINEVKSLSAQNIFKSFNIAKENFDNCLRDLKNSLNVGNNMNENKMLESLSFELNSDARVNIDSNKEKETYLKNELNRMVKENVSLRLELNYIYERLREDNKIFEIKEDILIKRNSRDNINSNSGNSGESKQVMKKSKSVVFNYNSIASNTTPVVNSNPIVVFKVKNDKKDEDYLVAKNYIKILRQSEFHMI